jgi:hypothetical protein
MDGVDEGARMSFASDGDGVEIAEESARHLVGRQ